jgi:hypothetical protein
MRNSVKWLGLLTCCVVVALAGSTALSPAQTPTPDAFVPHANPQWAKVIPLQDGLSSVVPFELRNVNAWSSTVLRGSFRVTNGAVLVTLTSGQFSTTSIFHESTVSRVAFRSCSEQGPGYDILPDLYGDPSIPFALDLLPSGTYPIAAGHLQFPVPGPGEFNRAWLCAFVINNDKTYVPVYWGGALN